MSDRLDLADIQGIVLRSRPMPYFGAYLLFRIDAGAAAREGLRRLLPHVTPAAGWKGPGGETWINVVFTAEGLRRMGVSDEILAGFPEAFVQGMASRSAYLGDVGDNDPSNWDWPHGGNGFHLGLLLMGRSEVEREVKVALGCDTLFDIPNLRLIARLNVAASPTMREHFGFADGISRLFIEGEGDRPMPGQGQPIKAGEFVLGYENEAGQIARAGGPEILWRNGTFIAIRKIRQNVAAFRRFLHESAGTTAGRELVAAKMMGRWASGCPLALSPDHDDAGIAADPMHRNDFRYGADDPDGSRTPLGSHIRRVNPRDALDSVGGDVRFHRVVRRGSTYGAPLPAEALEEDGEDRGIVLAMINADPERQFEFIQSKWINDGDFIGQGARSDPITGRRDLADDYVYPAKPVRRHLTQLPEFTVVRGGEHVFLPGISALAWIAQLEGGATPLGGRAS